MPLKTLRVSALLSFFLTFGLFARAEGLIALETQSLSSDDAASRVVTSTVPDMPELSGAAAGMLPISSLEHDKLFWLLARDAEGSLHWLSHGLLTPWKAAESPPEGLDPISVIEHYDLVWLLSRDTAGNLRWFSYSATTGWVEKATPPTTLHRELIRGGQAHILGINHDDKGNVTMLTYNAVTDEWSTVGDVALEGTITGFHPTDGGYVFDLRDADGNEQHTLVTVALTKRLLKVIDWVLIVLYLGFTAGIGFYYYKKEQNQTGEDFFVGGRSIPWWAAGVSLYATGTSAISYIATPAKSYATNWLYLANNVVGMVGTIFVAIMIVPLIRRLSLMSVYHYLEMRFHPYIRLLASALAIVLQLGGRMSIVLFLPSLAMAAVTGINVTSAIMIMGVITIGYTVMGGMKAVIWTDFIQVVVMLGGAFVAVGYILLHVDGGVGGFLQIAMADNKMETFDWDLSLTQATVWGFILLNILGVLVYPQDQVMMQRVLSTKSDKEAGWSVWTLAAIVVPGNLAFFGIGTALYVFYKQNPTHLNPMLDVDSTFPQFIAAELPAGITGLIIAGIFAASMSTLSSSINSVATLVSVDFYERYWKKATPEKSLRLAQIVTIIGGVIGIGTALLLAAADIKSALDTSFALMGLLGGGFAGCYALGLFTKRANWQGAFIGVGVSLVLTFVAWFYEAVHPFFYLFIANLATIVVGYLASLMFPAPQQSLLGLTVYTPRKKPVILTEE
jgi:SSS family transporter